MKTCPLPGRAGCIILYAELPDETVGGADRCAFRRQGEEVGHMTWSFSEYRSSWLGELESVADRARYFGAQMPRKLSSQHTRVDVLCRRSTEVRWRVRDPILPRLS